MSCGITKTELIRPSIEMFWEKAFSNTSVNEKAAIFNRAILNILNNFIQHETIVCNNRDPPGSNDKISFLAIHCLKLVQDRLNNFIESSKGTCYNRMASKLENT